MGDKVKSKHTWAIVIGIGVALSPIHNESLTNLVTIDGEVGFFIPAFGYAIWIMASLMYLTWNWGDIEWGSKAINIPLFIIVGSMGLSGIINGDDWQGKVSPLLMGVSLFAVYIVGRNLGATIFRAFIPFVVINAIVIIGGGLLNPGQFTGGLITNYCASAGYLVFGALVNRGRWQWALFAVVMIALFFIGALEVVFIVGVLGVAIISRRDWNRRFFVIVGALGSLVVVWAVLGYLAPLYEGNHNLSMLFALLTGEVALNYESFSMLLSGRWDVIVEAIRNISFIGHGYSLGIAEGGTVHNVPLIIMHQIGPVAAVAWVFVTVYCLIKTQWKYTWIAIIAMSFFDHYLWTQLTPLYWSLIGVSLTSNIKNDLFFRKS